MFLIHERHQECNAESFLVSSLRSTGLKPETQDISLTLDTVTGFESRPMSEQW